MLSDLFSCNKIAKQLEIVVLLQKRVFSFFSPRQRTTATTRTMSTKAREKL